MVADLIHMKYPKELRVLQQQQKNHNAKVQWGLNIFCPCGYKFRGSSMLDVSSL